MNIPALFLITFSCTWSSASAFYLRPDALVLPGIDGTPYEFRLEAPPLGDWLALIPYERYRSTKHRSKRQTDSGVRVSLNIPLGGGSFRPSWGIGGFHTQSGPNLNGTVEAGLRGNFGETLSWSLSGELETTGTNSHFRGTGQIGGQFGNTPAWSLGGVFSRSEGDWIGRLGGGFNNWGDSTIGVGLVGGGLGGHIDNTNGIVSVDSGSFPRTDPSKG